MTQKQAIEQGFNYRAKMYGFKGYWKDDNNEFIADWWLTDKLVEFFIYVDVAFCINEQGFPVVLIHPIN